MAFSDFSPFKRSGSNIVPKFASSRLLYGNLTSDPIGLGLSDEGLMWYRSDLNSYRFWDGTTAAAVGGGASDLQGAYNGGASIVTGANGPVQIVTGTTAYGGGLSLFSRINDSVGAFGEFVLGTAASLPLKIETNKLLDDTAITFTSATQVDFGVDLLTAGVRINGVNANSNYSVVFIKNTDISPTDEGAYLITAVSGGGNNIATLATITGGVPSFTATTGTANLSNVLRQYSTSLDSYVVSGSVSHARIVKMDGGTATTLEDYSASPTYGTISNAFVTYTNSNTSGGTDVPFLLMNQNGQAPHIRWNQTTPLAYTAGDIWRETGDDRLHYYDGSATDNAIAYLSDIGGGGTFSDSVFRVYDDGDNTKQFALQVNQVTTGTTRTFTVPDGNGIFPTTIGGASNLSTGTAVYAYTSGFSNTAYGAVAGNLITSGNRNTLVGSSAGGALTTQSDVTALGNGALAGYTGNTSVAVGSNAGLSATTGVNLTLVGAGADVTVGTYNYGIALGQGAKITDNNQMVVGSHGTSIVDVYFGTGANNDNTSPAATVSLHATNAFNQTDVAGSSLAIISGRGTGSSSPTIINFQTPESTVTGTTQQTLRSRVTIGDNITSLWSNTLNSADLRFWDTTNAAWVGFRAPNTVTSSQTWTLPAADGTLNQVLTTNGSGTLSWATPTGATTFADNVFRVYDNGDNTKNFALEVSAVSTATTRTFKVPNANGMLPAYNSSTISLITGEDGGGNVLAPVGTGTLNVHYGVFSGLGSMTTAYSNTAMGVNAGGFLTTGYENVNIGSHAGQNLNTGYRNVVIGAEAALALDATNSCVIIGAYAGGTGATANPAAGTIAIGDSALSTAQATATNNTAVGHLAGINVTTGDDLVLLGYTAGQGISTGSKAIGIGRAVFSGTFTGSDVVAIGDAAGNGVSSGTDDVFIGSNSGSSVTSGSRLTLIGNDTAAGSATTDSIALGNGATVNANNQLVIGSGTSSITQSYLGNGVTNATPANTALNASGGSGTDTVGASFTLAGGKATGNAVGGSVLIQTSTVGGSGTTLQTLGLVAEFDYRKSAKFSGRIQGAKGADVASASNLVLGYDGNVFDVTGTTTVNTISGTDWQAGSVIILQFDGALTVTHNSGGTNDIMLAGSTNLSTAAGTRLQLYFDGTDWWEISRTVA